MVLVNVQLVYANTAEETINSSKFIINLGIGVILSLVILAIISTLSGWLVDVLKQPKMKYYIEIWAYLIPIAAVIGLVIYIFIQIKNVSTMS